MGGCPQSGLDAARRRHGSHLARGGQRWRGEPAAHPAPAWRLDADNRVGERSCCCRRRLMLVEQRAIPGARCPRKAGSCLVAGCTRLGNWTVARATGRPGCCSTPALRLVRGIPVNRRHSRSENPGLRRDLSRNASGLCGREKRPDFAGDGNYCRGVQGFVALVVPGISGAPVYGVLLSSGLDCLGR